MTNSKDYLTDWPAEIFLRYSSFPGGSRVESGYENVSALKSPIKMWGWGACRATGLA